MHIYIYIYATVESCLTAFEICGFLDFDRLFEGERKEYLDSFLYPVQDQLYEWQHQGLLFRNSVVFVL